MKIKENFLLVLPIIMNYSMEIGIMQYYATSVTNIVTMMLFFYFNIKIFILFIIVTKKQKRKMN